MFRGNIPTRVDEKGRLKLPADFKREVDEQYGSQFYITSVDGKRARLYPMKTWEGIEASMMRMSPNDPVLLRFLDVTNYYGQMAEMDAQGRLLIPQLIRELGPVKEEVQVLGRMNYLEVVRADVLEAQLNYTAKKMPIHLSESDLAAFSDKTMPKVA